jgi:hypothetical protein
MNSTWFLLLSAVTIGTSYVQLALPSRYLEWEMKCSSLQTSRRSYLGFSEQKGRCFWVSSNHGQNQPDREMGIVVLQITLCLPYSVSSNFIEGPGHPLLRPNAVQCFINGFGIAALVLTVVNMVQVIPSILRGPRYYYQPQTIAAMKHWDVEQA